ncbi:hypothetical protein ACFX1X_021128 [Malus domestica]
MGLDLISKTLWTNLKNTRTRKSQIRYTRRGNWRFAVSDWKTEGDGELGWGVFPGGARQRNLRGLVEAATDVGCTLSLCLCLCQCPVTTVTPFAREIDGANISMWVTSRASREVT